MHLLNTNAVLAWRNTLPQTPAWLPLSLLSSPYLTRAWHLVALIKYWLIQRIIVHI